MTGRIVRTTSADTRLQSARASVIARIGLLRQTVGQQAVASRAVTLVVDVRTSNVLPPMLHADHSGRRPARATGPDTISFWVEGTAGGPLAELDGRYLSSEVATGFTGRVIGMCVTSGTAHFDWCEARPRPVRGDENSPKDRRASEHTTA